MAVNVPTQKNVRAPAESMVPKTTATPRLQGIMQDAIKMAKSYYAGLADMTGVTKSGKDLRTLSGQKQDNENRTSGVNNLSILASMLGKVPDAQTQKSLGAPASMAQYSGTKTQEAKIADSTQTLKNILGYTDATGTAPSADWLNTLTDEEIKKLWMDKAGQATLASLLGVGKLEAQ